MNLPTETAAAATSAAGTSAPRAGVRVQLVELRRRFGQVNALDGLSLEADPGQVLDPL